MKERDYFPIFDFLRAAAAFGVFFSHTEYSGLLPNNFGNACVQVFFALSGFLIGGILLNTKMEDLPRFYFNRSTRIWIPYFIAIAIVLAVTVLKQGMSDPKFFEFFFYDITFVYNWFGPPQLAEYGHRMPLDGTGNHFWSICVEEQFYLLAPFALLFLPRLVVAGIMFGLAGLNFFEPHYFAAISLGVLLAIFTDQRYIVGSLCAGVAVVLYIAGIGYQQWMPFAAAAIVAASSWRGPQQAIGRVLGGASYSFYLNGWIGLFIAHSMEKRLIPSPFLGFVVATIVSVSIAILHYWTIDQTIARSRAAFFSARLGVLCCVVGLSVVAFGLAAGIWYFPFDARFR